MTNQTLHSVKTSDWLTGQEEENSDKHLQAPDGRYFCLTFDSFESTKT